MSLLAGSVPAVWLASRDGGFGAALSLASAQAIDRILPVRRPCQYQQGTAQSGGNPTLRLVRSASPMAIIWYTWFQVLSWCTYQARAGHRFTLCRGKEVMRLIKLVSLAGYCGGRY